MSPFTVTVVNRPAIRTAGIKTRTSMKNANRDCVQLWEMFCPSMEAFPVDEERAGESYGISVMIEGDVFDYWAVMPISPTAPIPDGMDVFDIPEGPYAECRIPTLAELSAGYTWLYSQWAPTQERYAVDYTRAGLELYTADYRIDGSLTLYCPLLEK